VRQKGNQQLSRGPRGERRKYKIQQNAKEAEEKHISMEMQATVSPKHSLTVCALIVHSLFNLVLFIAL